MILSNYCIYHVDVQLLFCMHIVNTLSFFRTGLQCRTVCNWLVIPCINVFEIKKITWKTASLKKNIFCHYNGVILSAMASHITSITIVYLTVYSGADRKRTSKLRVTGLCEGNSPVTVEFPVQRARNAENFSIWWRHHKTCIFCRACVLACVTTTLEPLYASPELKFSLSHYRSRRLPERMLIWTVTMTYHIANRYVMPLRRVKIKCHIN